MSEAIDGDGLPSIPSHDCEPPSFRDRLGGRWAIAWPSYLLASTLIAAIAALWAGNALGLEATVPPAVRVLTLAVASLWWFLIATVLLDGADRFTRARRDLITDASGLEVTGIREAELISALGVIVVDQGDHLPADDTGRIRAAVHSLRASTRTLLPVADWWQSAYEIQRGSGFRGARDAFRPRLEGLSPHPGLTGALREVVRSGRFTLLPALIVILVVTVPHAIASIDVLRGIAVASCVALAATGFLALVNLGLAQLAGKPRILLYAAALVAITAAIGAFIAWPRFNPGSGADIAASVLATGVTLVASSGVQAIERSRALALADLVSAVEEQRIYQVDRLHCLADLTRTLGDTVDRGAAGRTSMSLFACANALDAASTSAEVDRWRHALEWGTAMVTTPISTPGTRLRDALEVPIQPWRGFLDVRLDVDEDLREPIGPPAGNAIETISCRLTEILDEAGRSGRYRTVCITARPGSATRVGSASERADQLLIDIVVPAGPASPIES